MRLLRTVLPLVLLSACSTATPPPSHVAAPVATPAAGGGSTPVPSANGARGCGATSILVGSPPAWTAGANPPAYLRYVVSAHGDVAGFLFADPLRSGHPSDPSNKILWVVKEPRNGHPLLVTGHPLNAASPLTHDTEPADASPGEIYPSIIDEPAAGCWQLTLTWSGHTDTVDLPYR